MVVYFARSQYGTAIRISLPLPLRFLSYLLAFFSSFLAAPNFFFTKLSRQTGGSAFLARFEPVDLRWRVIDRSANSIFSEASDFILLR